MFAPGTSTGPRMYLAPVPGSQEIIGLAGSWTVSAPLPNSAGQSKASNALNSSGVIQLVSEAFFGFSVGFGKSAAGVRWSSGVASKAPAMMTGRNSMLAEAWISWRVRASGTPGMETTTLRPDWVVISASETPEPSTRSRMISTAWSSCSCVASEPPCTRGARIIWVPPSRSRASFGAKVDFPPSTPVTRMAAEMRKITPSHSRDLRACLIGPVVDIVRLSDCCDRAIWRAKTPRKTRGTGSRWSLSVPRAAW